MVDVSRRGRIIIGLLVVTAGFTLADPHHHLLDNDTRYNTDGISPSVIWEHAQHNTLQTSYTKTLTIRPTNSSAIEATWRYEYNPDARRHLVRGYSTQLRSENWTSFERFYGDSVVARRHGESDTPFPENGIYDAEVVSKAAYPGFEAKESVVGHPLDTEQFRHLKTNESQVIVGVTTANNYADLLRADESQVLNGSSFRAYIDRDTGRISKIVEVRRFTDRGDVTTDSRRTYTFSKFGNTDGARPNWAGWNPMEVVFDLLSL